MSGSCSVAPSPAGKLCSKSAMKNCILGDQRYGIGIAHQGQEVFITFDPGRAQFIVEDDQRAFIKVLTPKNLTVAHITGLDRNGP
jgi:hypothetical protein